MNLKRFFSTSPLRDIKKGQLPLPSLAFLETLFVARRGIEPQNNRLLNDYYCLPYFSNYTPNLIIKAIYSNF